MCVVKQSHSRKCLTEGSAWRTGHIKLMSTLMLSATPWVFHLMPLCKVRVSMVCTTLLSTAPTHQTSQRKRMTMKRTVMTWERMRKPVLKRA